MCMYVYRPLDETLVLKNSAAMADRVFKNMRVKTRDDDVITPSEVVRSARFICLLQYLFILV